MKFTKLLILTAFIAAVAVTCTAPASQINLKKQTQNDLDGLPNYYLVGDTIHYVLTVQNPFDNTATNTLTDIHDHEPNGTDVYFVEPGVDPPLVQAPNDTTVYYLDYTVAEADLIEVLPGVIGVRNTFHVVGYDSADDGISASTERNSRVVAPSIKLVKYGDRSAFCEGTEPNVLYTYEVTNTGNEDINDVNVADDTCSPLGDPTGDDGDGLLNPGETWTYTCSMTLTGTTINSALAEGYGLYTGAYVSDTNDWLVEAVPPPVVSVDPPTASICADDANGVQFCAVVDPNTGVGPFTYLWSPGGETTQCITATVAGDYCVTVTDEGTGCDANACGTLTVNDLPSCEIIPVAPPQCPSDGNNFAYANITGGSGSGTLSWEFTAGTGWAIVGAAVDVNVVEYSVADGASQCATLTLYVEDSEGCKTECSTELCCVGNTFCSFTQGFYGNKGGKACGGMTTTEIINALIEPNDPVVIGVPGRSITFDSAKCIISLLPAGGTPSILPSDLGDIGCDDVPSSLIKKGRLNNVLIGQLVALTLNSRLGDIPCNPDESHLGSFVLPDSFCTVNEGGCPEHFEIPESLVGLTVNELIGLANELIGGADVGDVSISDIYNAATAINEGFDECRTVIGCPAGEICGNGCDDDFDGLIDDADPDCAPQ